MNDAIVISVLKVIVLTNCLLIEDEDGQHYLVDTKYNTGMKQVVYLPIFEMGRTH